MGSTEPLFDAGCSLWLPAVVRFLTASSDAPVRRLCLSWGAGVPNKQQLIQIDNREMLALRAS